MTKLTKRTVDATDIRSSDYVIWDEDLPGFGLRVFKSGRRSLRSQRKPLTRPQQIRTPPRTIPLSQYPSRA
jgi:hypothetical protein